MEQLVIKLSSTALGKSGCILNFHRTVVDGYKELSKPSRMVYGIAVHKYIDTMFQTNSDFKAAALAAKEVFNNIPKDQDRKSPHLSDQNHMLTTCINLWVNYVMQDSSFNLIMLGDKPATEQTFEIPYFENEYVKIYLCGTIDKVGQFHGGCYAIGDWKFTSSWDSKAYFTRYELSRQLRFYRLACLLKAETEPDSTLGRVGATRMGTFIDACFLKPDANDNTYARSEVFQFTDIEMFQFRASLDKWILEFSDKVKRNELHIKEGILNGSCESRWGLCSFWNVCRSPDHIGELLLKQYFKRQVFDPLNYNDMEVT
jgi:hypothetical protein